MREGRDVVRLVLGGAAAVGIRALVGQQAPGRRGRAARRAQILGVLDDHDALAMIEWRLDVSGICRERAGRRNRAGMRAARRQAARIGRAGLTIVTTGRRAAQNDGSLSGAKGAKRVPSAVRSSFG